MNPIENLWYWVLRNHSLPSLRKKNVKAQCFKSKFWKILCPTCRKLAFINFYNLGIGNPYLSTYSMYVRKEVTVQNAIFVNFVWTTDKDNRNLPKSWKNGSKIYFNSKHTTKYCRRRNRINDLEISIKNNNATPYQVLIQKITFIWLYEMKSYFII